MFSTRLATAALAVSAAAAALLGGASAASAMPRGDGAPVPVPVPAHHAFLVVVNGGADVTRYPLTPGEVIFCGGVAHRVGVVKDAYGTYEVTLVPRLAATSVCVT